MCVCVCVCLRVCVCLLQAGRKAGDPALGRYIADTLSAVPRLGRGELERMFNDNVQDSLMVSYLANLLRAQVRTQLHMVLSFLQLTSLRPLHLGASQHSSVLMVNTGQLCASRICRKCQLGLKLGPGRMRLSGSRGCALILRSCYCVF